MLANCVSGSRMVEGLVLISSEIGKPRISDPRIRNTSLTSLKKIIDLYTNGAVFSLKKFVTF
jgi:hypothetical protein